MLFYIFMIISPSSHNYKQVPHVFPILAFTYNIFFCNFFQVIYSDEERKFNKEITVGLIRSELLNLAEYNVHMAKLIDGGRNSM
jgi:hypothetical protein